MEKITCLLILSAVLGTVQCIFSSEPLYLTPLIESQRFVEARARALVTGEVLAKGIESYSGFLTVNKTYNSNLFFWYFPAKNNAANAPVVLWMQGGPGGSSLYGLFMENGPLFVNEQNRLEKRAYSWHADHNLVYIDNPVGAGFSFTDNPAGYAKRREDYTENLFSAMRQFIQLFSELKNNPLYITGESYAGKYVPSLAYAIHEKRNSADPADRINLKGIAIGNGVVDPVHQILFGDYFYQLGFIDKKALSTFNARQNAAIDYIGQGNFLAALQYTFSLVNTPTCLFNNLTGFTSPYNYNKLDGYTPLVNRVSNYLVNSNLKNSLNVGNKPFVAFVDTNPVLGYLQSDILVSVAPQLAELANYYKVFIYNGQMDLLVGPTLTENYLSYLPYNGASEFNNSARNFWRVNNEIAGYWKRGGNLTFITVRLAGHMVPVDQPVWAYDLLKRLTYGTGF